MDKEYADFIWKDTIKQVLKILAIYGSTLMLFWVVVA